MKRIIVPISVIMAVNEDATPEDILGYVQDNLDSMNSCLRKGGDYTLSGINDLKVSDIQDCD